MELAEQRSTQTPELQLSPLERLHEAPSTQREPSALQVWICCGEAGLHREVDGAQRRQPTLGTHDPLGATQAWRSTISPSASQV
ncbi:MAG: hypothetical protein IPN17_16530 [Deltaproteobacteria bacterium]|nr:hypothetical protein [Deltaproteobacteria bacterium]